MGAPRFACAGCGQPLAFGTDPFRCPQARPGDEIDHVIRLVDGSVTGALVSDDEEPNPFVRYRRLLASYALAVDAGLADETFVDIVREVDEAVTNLAGVGFRQTPFARADALGARLGFVGAGGVWVKDETGNVAGSHKARHLMGLMLYLLLPPRAAEARPPLAIASCGNAALAAAVVARAAGWPLEVFVPPHADASTMARLIQLEAVVRICHREAGVAGDPCYLAFRRALAEGALPFCCQGSDNGLTIDGARTLAWEMVSALRRSADVGWPSTTRPLDAVFLQVGGGAMASAVIQGFGDALRAAAIVRMPRIYTVQTSGAYPLKHAYDRIAERALSRVPFVVAQGYSPAADRERADLVAHHPEIIDEEMAYARAHRSQFMVPWPTEPRSLAHGILDDETYDWAAVVEGMLRTAGWPLVVGEERILEANTLAAETTSISVDHTGSAGLAGLMKAVSSDSRLASERVAVIFSGVRRGTA